MGCKSLSLRGVWLEVNQPKSPILTKGPPTIECQRGDHGQQTGHQAAQQGPDGNDAADRHSAHLKEKWEMIGWKGMNGLQRYTEVSKLSMFCWKSPSNQVRAKKAAEGPRARKVHLLENQESLWPRSEWGPELRNRSHAKRGQDNGPYLFRPIDSDNSRQRVPLNNRRMKSFAYSSFCPFIRWADNGQKCGGEDDSKTHPSHHIGPKTLF